MKEGTVSPPIAGDLADPSRESAKNSENGLDKAKKDAYNKIPGLWGKWMVRPMHTCIIGQSYVAASARVMM
jgi:hypothetical protein